MHVLNNDSNTSCFQSLNKNVFKDYHQNKKIVRYLGRNYEEYKTVFKDIKPRLTFISVFMLFLITI